MIDVAVVAIAVACVVLAGFVVQTVIQVRKTVRQLERILSQVNAELPELLNDLKQTNENVRVMSARVREGVEQASVLMLAVGDVGRTVHHVHGVIRGKSTMLLVALGRALTGFRTTAFTLLKNYAQKKGGG